MALKYDVHAAGSAYSFQKFVLGKFPMSVPELRKEAGGKWRMRQDTADGGAEWELQEGSLEGEQGPKFRGVPDAGLAGTAAPSNYFLLVKEKGSDVFTAVPVSEWVTFKPVGRRGPQRCARKALPPAGAPRRHACAPALTSLPPSLPRRAAPAAWSRRRSR
jgi:hypothetical protein